MAVEMRIAHWQVSQVGLLKSSGGAVVENIWRNFKLVWPWSEIGKSAMEGKIAVEGVSVIYGKT